MFCGRRRAGIQPNGVETLERRAPPTTKRAPDRRTYRLKIPVSVHLWALGRRLQADLLKRVESEPNEPQVLPLDFAGVEAASASFLRESVVGFCKALRARRSRYYPIVANAPESVLEDLALLSERGEPLLACELTLDGALRRPRLIGDLDPKQKLAFELVCRLGEADAREVCTAHGEWDGQGPVPNYWNNRLAALVEQGLLMELPHGRSKRYRPVVEGGVSFMGEGFIRKAAESFRKKRDRDRMALIERDLLTVNPECGQTTGLARLHPNERVGAGDEVALELDGERVAVYRCNKEIGVLPNPTPELLNIVKGLFGAAPAVVVRVHPISGTADIALGCP